MNETQVKMMETYGVLVLPEDIDHAAYVLVVEALLFADQCGHETVVLYCAGGGGDVNAALAIVDVIQLRGNVIGLLPGQADSSHATVWLGCSERYVYPLGAMGIHEMKFTVYDKTSIDRQFARNYGDAVQSYHGRVAKLLCDACAEPELYTVEHWLDVLHQVGASGVVHYDAEHLILFGIAKPVSAFVMPVVGGDDVDESDGQLSELDSWDMQHQRSRENFLRRKRENGVNKVDGRGTEYYADRVPGKTDYEKLYRCMQWLLTLRDHASGVPQSDDLKACLEDIDVYLGHKPYPPDGDDVEVTHGDTLDITLDFDNQPPEASGEFDYFIKLAYDPDEGDEVLLERFHSAVQAMKSHFEDQVDDVDELV